MLDGRVAPCLWPLVRLSTEPVLTVKFETAYFIPVWNILIFIYISDIFNSSFGLPTLVTKICQLIRPWDNLSRRKIYLDIFELREKTLTGVKRCKESPRHVTVSSCRRLTFQIYYNRSNNLIFAVPTSFFLVVAQTFLIYFLLLSLTKSSPLSVLVSPTYTWKDCQHQSVHNLQGK
jgi:hypothetical protein